MGDSPNSSEQPDSERGGNGSVRQADGDLAFLEETGQKILAECRRLRRFYDRVKDWLESDELRVEQSRDLHGESGLQVLRTLYGEIDDGDLSIADPALLWSRLDILCDDRFRRPWAPLPLRPLKRPPLINLFRSPFPDHCPHPDRRFWGEASASKAAIFARSRLLEILAEDCLSIEDRLKSGVNSVTARACPITKREWPMVCRFLGGVGGDHFEYLAAMAAEELKAAADMIRDKTRLPLPGNPLAGPKSSHEVPPAGAVDGRDAKTPRPLPADGPHENGGDFWYRGKPYPMPPGLATKLIRLLWKTVDSPVPYETIKSRLWPEGCSDTAFGGVRTLCNNFFDEFRIPFYILKSRIEECPVQLFEDSVGGIEDTLDNILDDRRPKKRPRKKLKKARRSE